MSIIEPVIKLACCDVPTVYSNKQSYYECLCYLGYKINECIEALNNYGDEWKGYVDEQIGKMRTYVDTQISETKTYATGYTDTAIAQVNKDIADKYKELSQLINSLDSKIDDVNESLLTGMSAMEKRLIEMMKTYLVDNIEIYDPVTGMYLPIAQVIENIYGALRYWGIDCNEFDSLGFTCDSFDALNISANDFDIYAGLRIGKNSLFWMSNPFTGEKDFYQNIIYTLADYHRSSPLTATEYDALQLTATVYDSKQITAYQYDFNGKSLLS